MSGLDIRNEWHALTSDNIAALPAQLGVYEIADEAGTTLKIGYAGGHSLFGMRSVLEEELAEHGEVTFRHEFTHGYLTRWNELLMVHHASHGELPPGNHDHNQPLGTLSPGTQNTPQQNGAN